MADTNQLEFGPYASASLQEDPNPTSFDELLAASDDGMLTVTNEYGNEFTYRLDPKNRSVTVLKGSHEVTKDQEYKTTHDLYGQVLRNMEKDAFKAKEEVDPGFTADPSAVATTALAGEEAGEAERETLEWSQEHKLGLQMTALGLGGLVAAVATGAPVKYERDLREDVKEEPEGLTAEQKKLMMKAQMGPAAAMSKGMMMADQAAMAATGNVMSAAALAATRDARNRAVVEAARTAGMNVAAADIATLEKNIEKKERKEAALAVAQMKRRQAIGSISSQLSVALASAMVGMTPTAPLSTLGLVINHEVPGMTEEKASAIARQIGGGGKTRAQIIGIYGKEGLTPPPEEFFTEMGV